MPNESEALSHGRRTSLARAYPPPWRCVAGGLVAASRASLPALAVVVAARLDEPIPLPTLLAALAAFSALPGPRGLAARTRVRGERRGARAGASRARTEPAARGAVRVDRARGALATAAARTPASRCACVRARCCTRASRLADPEPLLGALADAGGVEAAREALREPMVVYAHAKQEHARGLGRHPLFKFPGFALLPAGVLFNAHQHIAYGGSLGQCQLEGLAPYLQTFAVYWATVCVYLVLYASVWRALAERPRGSRRAPDRRAPRGRVGPSRSPAGSSITSASPRSCWLRFLL